MSDNNSPATVEGFILTRQWAESSSGLILSFWLATEGAPVCVRVSRQEAVCFLPIKYVSRLDDLLKGVRGWRVADTKLKAFDGEAVSAIYFTSQRQLFAARDRLASKNIFLLEADIKPTDRFLMERFVTGAAEVYGSINESGNYRVLLDSKFRSSDYRPSLKAVSLDIETDYQAERLYSIALFSDELSVVQMIGPVDEQAIKQLKQDDIVLSYYPDEKSLLQGFVQLLVEVNPDVIMGWNVVNFDFRCLQNFADRNNVELQLGRDGSSISWRQARDNQDRYYALIPGRVILDGIELMRSATYVFENFSLEYVARQILKRGKLVDDVDQRGQEITEQFINDKPALARYNLEDCRLVWDIFKQEDLLGFAIERSKLTGLEFDRYGGSVAALDFLYLPRLHRSGYVAPALEQLEASNVSPGGYVMQSIPGIHNNVIVLDFKSLYPSIIRTFNVDPLALVVGLDEEDPIPGYEGGKFSRTEVILPELIETLWQARDRAKADSNKVLSQAIKIIMNSFYGVLGTTGCRFLDSRLVSSITRRGHDIIIRSKDFIEEQGFQVIYGDTDSVFVFLGDMDDDAVQKTGRQLAMDLNAWWSRTLEEQYGVVSHLEMEFETHFTRFLMPTVRGTDTGSKKRYAGMLSDSSIMFKGLETVRSDWSPLAREFQQVLYRKVFEEKPYQEYIKQLVNDLQEGKYESELVLRKRLRRKLADYVKNVPPHVQAARKAEEVRRARNLPSLYDSGGWVEYIMTMAGPEPRQYRQSPIDYDFYIDKQLAPIADSILVFSSSSMDKVLDRQIGLF